MTEVDLEHLLKPEPACPSEAALDRLHLGELSADAALTIREHVEQCRPCQKRMALREKGFQAFEHLDEHKLRAGIEQSLLDKDLPTRVTSALRDEAWFDRRTSPPAGLWRWASLGVALAASVILFVFLLGDTGPAPGDEGQAATRTKGGVKLRVYRERNGDVDEMSSGEVFKTGDRLRFKLDLPREGQVMVVGVETEGSLFACFPAGNPASSAARPSGKNQMLSGAIRLTESQGEEWLHLVFCPQSFSLDQLRSREPAGTLEVPTGCMTSPFKMRKAGR